MTINPPVDESAWRRAVDEVCATLGWVPRIETAEGTTLVICPLPGDEHLKGVLFVIAPVARSLADGGGRFTFDYPALAATTTVTLDMKGSAKTISCAIDASVLAQFR